ncbi:MAG TPA: hypothetical protein VN903_17610, partial [Polyangia bacterium]|nr:hypothetical protein [Polyangia bacterium]
GARPVMFDRPDARHWLGDHAEYIPEGSHAEVVTALAHLVSRPYRPVTPAESAWATATFDWRTIIGGFWERVLR